MKKRGLEMQASDYKRLYEIDPSDYIRKVLGELSELSQAINHYHEEKAGKAAVMDELADVVLQCEKIFYLLSDFDDANYSHVTDETAVIYKYKESKLKNITDRIL